MRSPRLNVKVFDAWLRMMVLEASNDKFSSLFKGIHDSVAWFDAYQVRRVLKLKQVPLLSGVSTERYLAALESEPYRTHLARGLYFLSLVANKFSTPVPVEREVFRSQVIPAKDVAKYKPGSTLKFKHRYVPVSSWSVDFGFLDMNEFSSDRRNRLNVLKFKELRIRTTDIKGRMVWHYACAKILKQMVDYTQSLRQAATESRTDDLTRHRLSSLSKVLKHMRLRVLAYSLEKEVILYHPNGLNARVLEVVDL